MTAERRRYQRVLGEELVKVDVVSDDNPEQLMIFECNSKDFSSKGIRLHGHQSLALNARVNLVVHMSAHQLDYRLTGLIKWVTETTEHEILAGIELHEENESDIEKWQVLFN